MTSTEQVETSGPPGADPGWSGAWRRARALLEGVTRDRVAASDPGVELAILDWGGEGELAIFHHANGFCAATLAPIAHALRDRYRVVSIDARGHGDSTSVSPHDDPRAYAWATLVDDLQTAVHAILARTGRPRVALGIGHSFGGALSLAAELREPGLFERLLLCDPVILPPLTLEERRQMSRGPGLAASTRKRRDRFPSREEAYAHCRTRALFADFTPEALALYVGEGMRETEDGEIALKCDREIEAAIFDQGGSLDFDRDIERVRARVLFLHAGRGNFDVRAYESLAARMPEGRVERLDAGHLFPLEEPERVLEAVGSDPTRQE
ncbi:MAG TPA: alpha/beta hydrolase [Myxococcota bacterium]|nr:alpha/beta hydrolase [Myxococcales bacterium]HPG25615.1 alpha/beta hydrolase [Myxococcota bacterium]